MSSNKVNAGLLFRDRVVEQLVNILHKVANGEPLNEIESKQYEFIKSGNGNALPVLYESDLF